jgi:hypothetical protein
VGQTVVDLVANPGQSNTAIVLHLLAKPLVQKARNIAKVWVAGSTPSSAPENVQARNPVLGLELASRSVPDAAGSEPVPLVSGLFGGGTVDLTVRG